MADDNLFLKTLNFFSPANWWEAVVGAATGQNEDLKNNPAPSFTDRLGSVANNSQLLSGVGTGIDKATNAPVVGAPLKFVLDFGNRTVDSMFGGWQYNDAMNDTSIGTWTEGWRKSWDSWGTSSHVSAGQLIGASLNETFDPSMPDGALGKINPFTPQGVAQIDAMSKKNWYGNIAGGVADLTAGFVTPVTPLVKPIKAAREMGALNTLAKVESTETVFNAASKAGKLDDLSRQTGRSFFRSFAEADLSGESYAARLRDLARQTLEHATDNTSAMNFLGPRMESATEGAKRVMAETAVYARDLGPDMGTHVMGNAWLAVMGSSKAADEVISAAPLVMDKIANATAAPGIFDDVARAQKLLLDAHATGGDIRLQSIIDDTFETPKKKAQAEAIRGALEKAKLDAVQAHDFRQRVMALKPQFRQKVDGQYVDNFDTARLKESRANAVVQHQRARDELSAAKSDLARLKSEKSGINEVAKSTRRDLTSKDNLQNAGEAAGSKARRDAFDAFGPNNTADYYAREAGAAGQRVTDLQARIKELEATVAETRANRDLLTQTPLNDPQAMDAWRQNISSARSGSKKAVQRRDLLDAMDKVARRQIRDDVSAAKAIRPSLSATNVWLKDILEVGKTGDAAVLNVGNSLLARSKTAYRDWVGRTYMFDAGEYTPRTFFHVHPTDALASVGTAYGRNAVNVNDLYKGQQELGMYLKKSGVFEGDEIRNAVNELIGAAPSKVAMVVERYNDLMVERMLSKAGISDAQVKGIVGEFKSAGTSVRSYLTGRLAEADAAGQKWVKTNEFPGADDASDALHMIDSAYLRSHLADTVPFTDPHNINQMIRHIKDGRISLNEAGSIALGAVDRFNYYWKMFNLLRPALFFRNMLDTGLRASMLMGATGTFMSTANGSRNLVRNMGVKVGDWALSSGSTKGSAMERIGARMGADELTKHVLGDSGVKIDVGGGKTRTLSFYELQNGHATAASVASLRGALTRGTGYGEGLLGSATPLHNRLIKNVAKWDKYKATDIRWPEAYREHAQSLLASPTAKKMIHEHTIFDDGTVVTGPDRVKRLFSDPQVRDEYNKLSSELDMTREQFIEQLDWEMENMFPEPGMAETVLSGRLNGKAGDRWIEDHFPVEARFDVPGYESILPHGNDAQRAVDFARGAVDYAFKQLMDEPDFWLVRHPVAVDAYSKQLKLEASKLLESRKAKFGEDATLSSKDIKTMDARARTHAVSTVKKYMYDSTYSTELSQSVHRWAPFYNPWYDAMRSYSKLIYDNPNRLGTMAGLWNAPVNLSQWMPEPLVVDVNGESVRPGVVPAQGAGERFIVLSSLLGGAKPFGADVKLRSSSFNTILMGNTPWLPGWGPAVTVPMAMIINSNEDAALWLSSSDNIGVKTLMESLWPEGEVPRDDQILKSILPPVWRKISDVLDGDTYWRNVQFGMNQRYIESLRTGQPFDARQAQKEAEAAATSAGWLTVISQGVFGISARSDVAGAFYADEMHQIQAIPIEQVKAAGFPNHQAMFNAKHPEAQNLTWTFSRNETGVNATVVAQSEANRLRSLIDQAPNLGWFLVGSENIGGQFSQTSYNQQVDNTYGPERAGRKRLDSGEVMKQTLASYGWDQYLKFTARVEAMAAQYGFKPDAVSRVKSMYAQQLASTNPTWFEDYNTRSDKRADFFNKADLLSKDPKLANRQDIGMYVEYRNARQQVLDAVGLKSFGGTGQQSALARAALYQIGSRMATENLGFQQMWERMLSGEVEPMATDSRFIDGNA